jgi:hypothetical protein
LPKESGRFDLPIAIGILVATGQLKGHRRWCGRPSSIRQTRCFKCVGIWRARNHWHRKYEQKARQLRNRIPISPK